MQPGRRNFIKTAGWMSFLGVAHMTSQDFDVFPQSPNAGTRRRYQGSDLKNWEVVLGDALHACPNEPPVALSDIQTEHFGAYSELRANIVPRAIMAHNITFNRIIDSAALQFVHTCGFKFMIPFTPPQDPNATMNAQTFEGGLFIWDGADTRLDYGMAFQWVLNPWAWNPQDKRGEMRVWTGERWQPVGTLPFVESKWYEVKMILDPYRQTTALLFDGVHFPTQFSKTPKPADWGTEIAARLQAEIISIDPQPNCTIKASHKAQVKDWYWEWEYPYRTSIPIAKVCLYPNREPSSCSEAFITSPCNRQKVSGEFKVFWKPETCKMVLQYYQGGQLKEEIKDASSGATLKPVSPGLTQIKIWVPGSSTESDNIWVDVLP